MFLYKGLFGYLNVNISKYVTFVSHGRTRLSNTSKYILQGQICKTTTFQSSYYNRIVKIWNIVCKDICFDTVSSASSFKRLLKHKYSSIVNSVYDVEMACTWSLFRFVRVIKREFIRIVMADFRVAVTVCDFHHGGKSTILFYWLQAKFQVSHI